jgi:hypothetical protein
MEDPQLSRLSELFVILICSTGTAEGLEMRLKKFPKTDVRQNAR